MGTSLDFTFYESSSTRAQTGSYRRSSPSKLLGGHNSFSGTHVKNAVDS